MGGSRYSGGSSPSSGSALIVPNYAQIQDFWSGGGCISVWVNADLDGVGGYLIFKASDTSLSNGFLILLANNYPVYTVYFGQARATTASTWEVGEFISPQFDFLGRPWECITINYNSSTPETPPQSWITGIPQSVSGTAGSGTVNVDAGNPMIIGNHPELIDTQASRFAFVQIWSRTLSTPEVLESTFKPGSIRDGLVGCWNFLSSDERDLSPSQNNGLPWNTVASNESPF